MKKILLYYKFSPIQDPQAFCKAHKEKCRALGLLGRVYVAGEGINGTLAGDSEDIDAYKEYLRGLPGFAETDFKEDTGAETPFVKLIVKVRPEIVSLKAPFDIDPAREKAPYLSPKEWRRVLDSGEDVVILDVRNDYESRIGHFENAVRPDVKNFYDFPGWLEKSGLAKDQKVLMYCTGGIRCEKFSLLMKKKGFRDVYQLHGGIIKYAQEEGGKHYKGKCFVFDDRLAVDVSADTEEPLTRCEVTGVPCDRYLNCANPDCNKLFICSEEGARQMEGCCSEGCRRSERRKPFNPDNIYEPTRKWYRYFDEKPKSANTH